MTVPQALELALQDHQVGRLPEAEALYRQILAAQPNHADALHLVGLIASDAGLSRGFEPIDQPWPARIGCYSEKEYVNIAESLATDLPRLAYLRATLRDRMKSSPLMDAPRFARQVEIGYREMWRAWCAE